MHAITAIMTGDSPDITPGVWTMFEQILRIESRSGCNCRCGGGRFPRYRRESISRPLTVRCTVATYHDAFSWHVARGPEGGLVRETCLRDVAHYLLCWPL
jgi:hypothetical protein